MEEAERTDVPLNEAVALHIEYAVDFPVAHEKPSRTIQTCPAGTPVDTTEGIGKHDARRLFAGSLTICLEGIEFFLVCEGRYDAEAGPDIILIG